MNLEVLTRQLDYWLYRLLLASVSKWVENTYVIIQYYGILILIQFQFCWGWLIVIT